jgi:alpha-L-rhamnosidase
MGYDFSIKEMQFASACPIWPRGREFDINLMVGFRTVFETSEQGFVCLRIAASSLYRCFINGRFVGHGPARGPHGYYRVDEWDLTENLTCGQNIVSIEVVGYNVNSYYLLDQPSFLQAEIVSDGHVLAATGERGHIFDAYILHEKVQKVQRYSFQRTFVEAYRLWPGYDKWRSDVAQVRECIVCCEVEPKQLLPRSVSVPRFTKCSPITHMYAGDIEAGKCVEDYWKDRSLTNIGPEYKGYGEDELEFVLSKELQELVTISCVDVHESWLPDSSVSLDAGTYSIFDFGVNLSGFLGARIKCTEDTRLAFVFDEVLSDKDVDFKRLGCVNAISFQMPAGEYEVESFEPYTLKYLKIIVLEGACSVSGIYLRELTNPDVFAASFQCSDERLNRIFEAGLQTFKQNAVDIFMDCPSRERAGWLCDSFFTSRVEYDLTGNTLIERNFLENFLLPKEFPHLPHGMLPMCYPADHSDGNFIPNWALWFVVELEEYLKRSHDCDMVDRLKLRVLSLFEYFDRFRNEYGLLENLERWVFIEWSKANSFVQDVNYPTNMLYAGALAAAGRMYDLPDLVREADRIRQVIREQSFDGQFFCDNAVRENGCLRVTRNRTEVCQYYAFFFEVATTQTHPVLWGLLVERFGPSRKDANEFPEVHIANAFIGNYLRLELLSASGYVEQLRQEIVSYFLYMAEQTGTLWENIGSYASCNHGFASHVIHCLYRDILGINEVDRCKKVIKLIFPDIELKMCEGKMPAGNSRVFVKWWKQDNTLYYVVDVPDGYRFEIDNKSGMTMKEWSSESLLS